MASKRKPKSKPPVVQAPAPEEAKPAASPETAGAPAAEEVKSENPDPAVESPPPNQAETTETTEGKEQDAGGPPADTEVVGVTDTTESGGTPVDLSQGTDAATQEAGGPPATVEPEEPEEVGAVIQRRAAAAERWAEKQGWGPTETRKLIESAPGLVDKGWLWQCHDGTREFIAAEIPTDGSEFKDALAEVTLSKQERFWFLWNERLQNV